MALISYKPLGNQLETRWKLRGKRKNG